MKDRGSPGGFLLAGEKLKTWLSKLKGQFKIIAPQRERNSFVLKELEDLERCDLSYVGSPLSSLKYFLHPSLQTLFEARREPGGVHAQEIKPSSSPLLFFGIHACDLEAMLRQKQVMEVNFPDPIYGGNFSRSTFVGLTCVEAGDNCFCSSMGTGPIPVRGFDLLLTPLNGKFLLEAGSIKGEAILPAELARAEKGDLRLKETMGERAARAQKKAIEREGLPVELMENFSHPYWQELADRCLSCSSCTMVCPTCYCYNVVDDVSLRLDEVTRKRHWDSCQLLEFAAVHGGNFRKERVERLKQFMYHKLVYWLDQYDTYGCVGCGRCITYCPTRISIEDAARKVRGGSGHE